MDKKSVVRKRLSLASGAAVSLIDGPKTDNHEKPSVKEQDDSNKPFLKMLSFSVSKPGRTPYTSPKTNQDAFLVFSSSPEINLPFELFAVFDGHGIDGHYVSSYLSENLSKVFVEKLERGFENFGDFKDRQKRDEIITNIIEETIMDLDNCLKEQNFDTIKSGSTLLACLFFPGTLFTVNVGDSRAVLRWENPHKKYSLEELSSDHKPDLPEEHKRILKAGGRVAKTLEHEIDNEDDDWADAPYRVWLKNEDIPGLAMSRAMGDFMVKRIGVICKPEIRTKKLTGEEKGTLLLATDGVWEFLPTKKVMILAEKGTQEALNKIIKTSVEYWKNYGYGAVIDDITAVLVKFTVIK